MELSVLPAFSHSRCCSNRLLPVCSSSKTEFCGIVMASNDLSIATYNYDKTMANNYGSIDDGIVPPGATKWESRCIMIDVQKTFDSNQSIKIDLTSTLGASSQLPLAVKKAVRYWFLPTVNTKTEVVGYINNACRRNGFKISTLSNSKQGLDRRAQLVCSRGIVARRPRGKSHGVQTTTTRPVNVEEKCPFSLTVYECRKSGRWYLRKFGNGSRMHCGHCQLMPDQVGLRRYQRLTERDGSKWNEQQDRANTELEEQIESEVRLLENGVRSPEKDAKIMNAETGPVKTTNSPTSTKPQTNPMMGLPTQNPTNQMQAQNQKQVMGYIASLRDRILYRDYTDRLIMERARRFKEVEASMNGYGFLGGVQPYLNNGGGALQDQIGALSQKNSMNPFNRSMLGPMGGNQITNGQMPAGLPNHVGKGEIPSLIGVPAGEISSVDSKSSNASSSINQDQNNVGRSSNTEIKVGEGQNNGDRKRRRNDDDFQTSQSKIVDREKSLNNATAIHDHCSSYIGESFRTDLAGEEITKKRSIATDQALPDRAGSNAYGFRGKNEGEFQSDDSKEPSVAADDIASDQCNAYTETFDNYADEYAMLRPMASYNYPTGQD